MKLSFTTLGCPDWPFEKILSEGRRLGFTGIEIRGIEGEMLAEKIAVFMPGVQQDSIRRFADHGLTVTDFGTSVNFHDPDTYDANIKEGKAAIDVCNAMGFPAIRVFGDKVPDPAKEQEIIARVVRGITELCEYAESTDVQVWLETHGDFNTLDRVMGVINSVNHPKFGILWDVWHSDKTYGDDFRKFYEPIRSSIRHIHFKDHHRADGKFELCTPGEGDIPLRDIAKMLIADGYDGFFSLEWEKKWHPELPDADIAFPAYIAIFKDMI